MWTVEKLTAECQKLSDQFNDRFDIPVTINSRLTTTLGRCRSMRQYSDWAPIELQFSKKMLESSSEEKVLSVIQHEWAHYYVVKTTRENHGHDYVFKDICARIGCQNNQRVFKGVDLKETETKFKYEVWCPDCNKNVATFKRRCKTIENIEHYRCQNCGCRMLYYKQNW